MPISGIAIPSQSLSNNSVAGWDEGKNASRPCLRDMRSRGLIQGYLKFTDGSNLQVINESYAPQVGTGRQWDVQAVPGKTVSQVNFKIGASADQAATGFTYRISVQGCN